MAGIALAVALVVTLVNAVGKGPLWPAVLILLLLQGAGLAKLLQ